MNAAFLAGVAQDERCRIDHGELVAILDDLDILCAGDGDDREDRTCRLPALGAAACMVVGDVALDLQFHGP
jgi:hypothetical protein